MKVLKLKTLSVLVWFMSHIQFWTAWTPSSLFHFCGRIPRACSTSKSRSQRALWDDKLLWFWYTSNGPRSTRRTDDRKWGDYCYGRSHDNCHYQENGGRRSHNDIKKKGKIKNSFNTNAIFPFYNVKILMVVSRHDHGMGIFCSSKCQSN